MNKAILGLLGLALLGGSPLLGQTLPDGKKGEPLPPPIGAKVEPGACCQGGCCPKTKTICVPEHYVKEKKKVIYSSGCEKKCLAYYHGLFHGCGDCDKGHCGHAITVKYMIKKVQVCEHDAVKCNPVEVPACGHGRCCANGSCSGSPATVVVQPGQQPVSQPVSVIMPSSNK